MRTIVRVGTVVAVLVLVLLLGATASAAGPQVRPVGSTLTSSSLLLPAVSVTKNISVGKDPQAVVYDPATHMIYVTVEGTNSVKVINATTNAVAKTIPVGKEPVSILYNPSNKDLYVENLGSSNFSVIGSGNKVVSTVAIKGTLLGTTLYDPANGNVYTLSYSVTPTYTVDYNLSKINKTSEKVTVIPVGAGGASAGYDNASKSVVVSDSSIAKLSVVNSTTNAVTTVALPVGYSPARGLYNPATKDFYVLDEAYGPHGPTGTGNVSVLSASNTIATTIKTGVDPSFLQLDPVNHAVYVTNFGKLNTTTNKYPNSTLTIIGTSNKVAATLKVGKMAGIIAYSPKTNDLYVPCSDSNRTYIVNATTNTLIGAGIATQQYPFVAVYDPASGDVVVVGDANFTGKAVASDLTVISTSNKVANIIVLGVGPVDGDAYDPATKVSYVTNGGAGTVSIIN